MVVLIYGIPTAIIFFMIWLFWKLRKSSIKYPALISMLSVALTVWIYDFHYWLENMEQRDRLDAIHSAVCIDSQEFNCGVQIIRGGLRIHITSSSKLDKLRRDSIVSYIRSIKTLLTEGRLRVAFSVTQISTYDHGEYKTIRSNIEEYDLVDI